MGLRTLRPARNLRSTKRASAAGASWRAEGVWYGRSSTLADEGWVGLEMALEAIVRAQTHECEVPVPSAVDRD